MYMVFQYCGGRTEKIKKIKLVILFLLTVYPGHKSVNHNDSSCPRRFSGKVHTTWHAPMSPRTRCTAHNCSKLTLPGLTLLPHTHWLHRLRGPARPRSDGSPVVSTYRGNVASSVTRDFQKDASRCSLKSCYNATKIFLLYWVIRLSCCSL